MGDRRYLDYILNLFRFGSRETGRTENNGAARRSLETLGDLDLGSDARELWTVCNVYNLSSCRKNINSIWAHFDSISNYLTVNIVNNNWNRPNEMNIVFEQWLLPVFYALCEFVFNNTFIADYSTKFTHLAELARSGHMNCFNCHFSNGEWVKNTLLWVLMDPHVYIFSHDIFYCEVIQPAAQNHPPPLFRLIYSAPTFSC